MAAFVGTPWAVMWTVALAMYAGCKWLTWQTTTVHHVPLSRHAAYLLAWPGMDAASFLEDGADRRVRRCPRAEWIGAAINVAAGLSLLFGVARLVPTRLPLLAGWLGMAGVVLILHFGLFHLLSCWWRSRGVLARPLMNRPLHSTSVADFWGRRWNTAFRDLTHRFLFRPCKSLVGSQRSLFFGFLVSGAIHELVITMPAQGAYGGPTAFFSIQGAALIFERSAWGRRFGLGRDLRGRVFTIATVLLPVTLLFPRPFVLGVIVPFMHVLGAL